MHRCLTFGTLSGFKRFPWDFGVHLAVTVAPQMFSTPPPPPLNWLLDYCNCFLDSASHPKPNAFLTMQSDPPPQIATRILSLCVTLLKKV